MQRISTDKRWRALALAGLALGAVACDLGPDPDPRALMATKGYAPPGDYERRVEVATAALLAPRGRYPSAAPMGESRGARRPLQRPENVRVVVGRDVADSCDDELMRRFEAAQRGAVVTERALTSDRQAVEQVLLGRADFALIGGLLSTRERQAGLAQQLLGVELFALAVPPRSPVRSLDRTSIRRIFTGEVSDWQQLGFAQGPIVAVVPGDETLADRAARVLIPGDRFSPDLVPAAGGQQIDDQLRQHAGAICVVRVTAARRAEDRRLLQIDWAEPTPTAFANGSYPFGLSLQLVTVGRPSPVASGFLEFARGDDARALLGAGLAFVR